MMKRTSFVHSLMAESEEELKSLLMKAREESEKVGLKLNIQKTKIMSSGPITSWEIDGKQWKQCQTLFLVAPKSLQMVTAVMKLKDTYSPHSSTLAWKIPWMEEPSRLQSMGLHPSSQ